MHITMIQKHYNIYYKSLGHANYLKFDIISLII